MLLRRQTMLVILPTVALFFGCGESKPTASNLQTNDAAKLASLVTEFADTGTNLTMQNYFAKGAKVSPAEHKKYVARSYKIEGSPKVDGDQAKASVKITGMDSGKEEGTLEWKFAKEKEIWKIAEAPLP